MAGLAVVALLIPVNRWLAVKIEGASVRMMGYKDARLQVMGELLRGIHQVKLSAWEPRFIRKVSAPISAPVIKIYIQVPFNITTQFIRKVSTLSLVLHCSARLSLPKAHRVIHKSQQAM